MQQASSPQASEALASPILQYPDVIEDDAILAFPSWGKAIAQIGHYMAVLGTASTCNPPKIAVICLPRIDYAAMFASYGVFCSVTSEERTFSSHAADSGLGALVGKTVSFLKIRERNTYQLLGRLDAIDHVNGIATIITKKSATSSYSDYIHKKHWHLIRESKIPVDLSKGATERQRQKAGDSYREYHEIAKVMGAGIAASSTRTSGSYVTVIGAKSRFTEEVSALRFAHGQAAVQVGFLLNAEDESGKPFRNSGRRLDLLHSGRPPADASTSLCIIEAGRGVGDQIRNLAENQRAIVLLAANKRAHTEIVDQIAPFLNFRGEYPPPALIGNIPRFLKAVYIR